MKTGTVRAHVSNLKPLHKLEELHGLHLSPKLVGYPGSAIALHFRKALCTKFLAKLRSETSCFFWEWLTVLMKRGVPFQRWARHSFPFQMRLWKDSEGRKIALFNDMFKVHLFHLQTGKVEHLLLFSAHTGSCFHKSDGCWRYSCFAPVTVLWTFR